MRFLSTNHFFSICDAKKTTFFSSSKKKVALWDKKRRAVELPTVLRMNYELGIILLRE